MARPSYLTEKDELISDVFKIHIQKHVDHIRAGFLASERAIRNHGIWTLILGVCSLVLGFVVLANIDIICGWFGEEGIHIIRGSESVQEWIRLLILVVFIGLIIVAYNFLNKRISTRFENEILSADVRGFCHLYLVKCEITEYLIDGQSTHLRAAKRHFKTYSDELLSIPYKERTNTHNVPLDNVREYCFQHRWFQLGNDTADILSHLANLQLSFSDIIKNKTQLQQTVIVLEELVGYNFAEIEPALTESNRKIIGRICLRRMIEPMDDIHWQANFVEKMEKATQLKLQWIGTTYKRCETLFWKYPVIRYPLGLVFFGFLAALFVLVVKRIFGEDDLIVNAVILCGAGGALYLMKKKKRDQQN